MIAIHFLVGVLSTQCDNLGTVIVPHPLQGDVDASLLYLLTELVLQFVDSFSVSAN